MDGHLGWKHIKGVLQQQIDNRLINYGMKAATSVEKVLEEQFAKGETAGLELAKLILPHQIIHLETEVENLKRLVLDEQGDRDES
ncbi:MAG: hypothetical protein FVQ79_00230 [Planctomycetes bacterium]|nr:hypothetical protein [Planctomycetota bacterium]